MKPLKVDTVSAILLAFPSAPVILKREAEALNAGSVLSLEKEGLTKSARCSTAGVWIQARDC